MRRLLTARVVLMAVAIAESSFNRLKSRMKAVSHLWSMRHAMTARVVSRAVAFVEIIFYRLKAGMKAVSHL
jgi:hypothetical protein